MNSKESSEKEILLHYHCYKLLGLLSWSAIFRQNWKNVFFPNCVNTRFTSKDTSKDIQL